MKPEPAKRDAPINTSKKTKATTITHKNPLYVHFWLISSKDRKVGKGAVYGYDTAAVRTQISCRVRSTALNLCTRAVWACGTALSRDWGTICSRGMEQCAVSMRILRHDFDSGKASASDSQDAAFHMQNAVRISYGIEFGGTGDCRVCAALSISPQNYSRGWSSTIAEEDTSDNVGSIWSDSSMEVSGSHSCFVSGMARYGMVDLLTSRLSASEFLWFFSSTQVCTTETALRAADTCHHLDAASSLRLTTASDHRSVCRCDYTHFERWPWRLASLDDCLWRLCLTFAVAPQYIIIINAVSWRHSDYPVAVTCERCIRCPACMLGSGPDHLAEGFSPTSMRCETTGSRLATTIIKLCLHGSDYNLTRLTFVSAASRKTSGASYIIASSCEQCKVNAEEEKEHLSPRATISSSIWEPPRPRPWKAETHAFQTKHTVIAGLTWIPLSSLPRRLT
jgi:hypothetical protein